MSTLNEKNSNTEQIIHIMVTTLCNRNCKDCCNKQYNLNDIPQVTEEELKRAHTICITGGEPFLFADPDAIARFYKLRYRNIKNVYVYTNAIELANYLSNSQATLAFIDGVSVSIKVPYDIDFFEQKVIRDERILRMKSNLLYVFENLNPLETGNFTVIDRKWQTTFVPANNSIFRRA